MIVGVPRAALEPEGDTLATFTTTGRDHGGETERSFCSACGAPVFSVAAVMPDVTFLKAGSLDDAVDPAGGRGVDQAPRSRGRRTLRGRAVRARAAVGRRARGFHSRSRSWSARSRSSRSQAWYR